MPLKRMTRKVRLELEKKTHYIRDIRSRASVEDTGLKEDCG